jgi:hypothetical protein
MTLLASDARPAIWWSTPVECESALFRTRLREAASREGFAILPA